MKWSPCFNSYFVGSSFAYGNGNTTRLKYHLGDETEEKMIIDDYNDSPPVSNEEEVS